MAKTVTRLGQTDVRAIIHKAVCSGCGHPHYSVLLRVFVNRQLVVDEVRGTYKDVDAAELGAADMLDALQKQYAGQGLFRASIFTDD